MSLEKNMSLPGAGEGLQALPVEPASPAPVHSEPAFGASTWQSSVGNSLLAAAATSGPPPNTNQGLPLQFSFGNAAVAHTLIQRKAEGNDAGGVAGAPPQTATGPTGLAPAAAATTPTEALIVADTAESIGPGQMKKSQFLAALRTAVSNAVAEVSAGTPLSAATAPEIDRRFAQYSGQDARQLERTIRGQVPETAGVTSAAGFIPPIVGRVRREVQQAMPSAVTGAAGVLAAIGSAASQVVSGITSAASTVAEGVGSALSGIGSLFFKARHDGARETQDPEAIQSQLGAGQPLDGGVRSRMESAYGQSFSSVEVHADANARGLSENLNARAFTVGQHIAFAAGEYQPGTLIGDALIAHELAHVMQQRGGAATAGPAQKGTIDNGGLEEDADRAAVGAVVSGWTSAKKGLARMGSNILPSLKSGLRLQRCDKTSSGPIGTSRLATARTNFQTKNSHLAPDELRRIDAALTAVSADNINLQITYYDYYSTHKILKMGPAEAASAMASSLYATTTPDSDTIVRPDLLDPGFPPARLGSLLIHEITHTRHDTNYMGSRDYQEGESYGIEYFLAERAGERTRMGEILRVMSRPTSLTLPIGVPALLEGFRSQYATMQGLYEIIDTGHSSHAGSPFVTPALLTAAEARALAAELVATREASRGARLQSLLTWVKANLGSFTGLPPI